jgi:type I restriction enzyme, S subunit
MRFKPYPSYKPSRVDWLTEMPSHWQQKRLRFCAAVNPTSEQIRNLSTEDEVSFLPMEAIGEYGGLALDETRVIADVGPGYTEFDEGDVVVAKITPCFENGKGALAAGLLNGAAFGTTELHVLRAKPELDKRFLFYFTISHGFRHVGEGEMYGAGGQKRVPPEFCKNVRIVLPDVEEQIAIADFLDRETAKIDLLVDEKQTLIKRLNEKRAALISHTVTHGLPADAARSFGLEPHPNLKPSGVDWLGDVPSHWGARRLKHISDEIIVGVVVNPSSYVSDDGVPFLLGGDIREFQIDTSECNRCSRETSDGPLRKSRLSAGDLVVVRVGYPGVAAVVPPELEGSNCASMMIVRKNRRFDSQWLAYLFNSQVGRDQIEIVQYGAAQKQFNISHAVDFEFPFPPVEEQRAIASFLDRETRKLNAMLGEVDTAVARLQEYRAAIITAAVSGRIDVRRPPA